MARGYTRGPMDSWIEGMEARREACGLGAYDRLERENERAEAATALSWADPDELIFSRRRTESDDLQDNLRFLWGWNGHVAPGLHDLLWLEKALARMQATPLPEYAEMMRRGWAAVVSLWAAWAAGQVAKGFCAASSVDDFRWKVEDMRPYVTAEQTEALEASLAGLRAVEGPRGYEAEADRLVDDFLYAIGGVQS